MMVSSTVICSWSHLAELHEPSEIWVTPFWFRIFIAGLGFFAAIISSIAVTSIVLGGVIQSDGLQYVAGAALAICLSVPALQFFNPLDRHRWLRFALTRDGVYLPARGSTMVLIPWSAVVSVEVERWYGKGGEHSAAQLEIDLDEGVWASFQLDAGVDGDGRVRRVRLQVTDVSGDAIASRVKAVRDGLDCGSE